MKRHNYPRKLSLARRGAGTIPGKYPSPKQSRGDTFPSPRGLTTDLFSLSLLWKAGGMPRRPRGAYGIAWGRDSSQGYFAPGIVRRDTFPQEMRRGRA